MSTQHPVFNAHVELLLHFVKQANVFEQPRGMVNRLLEEAAQGLWSWPATVSALKLEDALRAARMDSTVDRMDIDQTLALYKLGVRAKETEAA